jgi:hypothetical protein
MHVRYSGAAVASAQTATTGALEPAGRQRRPTTPAQVLWAHKPLVLGRDTLVAVMLREDVLFVRVVGASAGSGVGRWVPARDVLTEAQANRWAKSTRFQR